jgi:hypothetical protein
MRATTIRFTPELWELLEQEAAQEGVSVAQYVRDASLFRVAYAAGSRGEAPRPRAAHTRRRPLAAVPA